MARLNTLLVTGLSRFLNKVKATQFEGDGALITNLNPENLSAVVPVAKGGTGKTTGKDAANYFINSLDTGSSQPVDADYYVSQYVSGGTTTTTYHRRPMSALWGYIKNKIVATFANKSAASGGTDNCLVTTGQKYTWNSKTSNTGTVIGVQVQAISPVKSSTSTPQSTMLNTTISLADGYGDTKNPYTSKTAKYVLAAPTNAAGAPTFRQLSSLDIDGLGTAANYTASISVENNNDLPTGAAIQNYVTGLGYQANQNAFSNVAVGSSTIQADSVTDTLTIAGSGATSVTADTTNDKITISSTDTKNTAGSTDTSSKIFLIGATTQAANPTTNSQDTAYVGTDGHLYSNSKQVVNLSDSQALTNKTYNGYTLAAACAKGVDTSMTTSSTSTNLPTTAAVANYFSSGGTVNGALDIQNQLSANSATFGNLLVNGDATFTNGIAASNGKGVIASTIQPTTQLTGDIWIVLSD